MRNRHFLISLVIVAIIATAEAQAQEVNLQQKVWILIQSRSIKEDTILANAFYKFRFDNDNMYITISPSRNEMSQPYSVTGNTLKGRFVNYIIESITDTSLTLSVPNNRRMYLLAEGHSPCGDRYVIKMGEFNGHPYYKAFSYLMPSNSGEPLFNAIEKAIHFDRQRQKITVSFSFIVDEKGMVQGAKIVRSYSPEVDAIVLEQLQKSSGKWQPPTTCGAPVATGLSYTFEYDAVTH